MGDGVMTRRAVVGGALAAAMLMGRAASAQESPEEAPPKLDDGIGGGGSITVALGTAEFSLAALARDDGDGAVSYIGSFALRDTSDPANPLAMETDYLSGYQAPDAEVPGLRRIIGWATANGSGPFPYIVEVDGTADAAEQEVLVLFGDAAATLLGGGAGSVCDCGGFDYRIKGKMASGGVTLFPVPAAG